MSLLLTSCSSPPPPALGSTAATGRGRGPWSQAGLESAPVPLTLSAALVFLFISFRFSSYSEKNLTCSFEHRFQQCLRGLQTCACVRARALPPDRTPEPSGGAVSVCVTPSRLLTCFLHVISSLTGRQTTSLPYALPFCYFYVMQSTCGWVFLCVCLMYH